MESMLSKICNSVTHFFKVTTPKIGKEVGFTKRHSKLTALHFTQALLMSAYQEKEISLAQIARQLKQLGVNITKQGLHKRFKVQGRKLMENLFKESLNSFKMKCMGGIDLLKTFAGVYLFDSSAISLPESMATLYPGRGGTASTSALKIQLMIDYINNHVESLDITSGKENDQGYKKHLASIKEGCLYLQDLGYFSIETFKLMSSYGAYFISRYLPQTKLYIESSGKDSLDLISKLKSSESSFSQDIWLGREEKTRIKARLVVSPLGEEEIEARVKKAYASAGKKGRRPSGDLLELLRWSIYITNTTSEQLPDGAIYLVYSLRWQIELFFKLCKSEAGVTHYKSALSDRVICEFYAKMINVIILLSICQPIRWQEKEELSLRKAYKLLRHSAESFCIALQKPYRLLKFLRTFCSDLKVFGMKDRGGKKRCPSHNKLMDLTGQEVLI